MNETDTKQRRNPDFCEGEKEKKIRTHVIMKRVKVIKNNTLVEKVKLIGKSTRKFVKAEKKRK